MDHKSRQNRMKALSPVAACGSRVKAGHRMKAFSLEVAASGYCLKLLQVDT